MHSQTWTTSTMRATCPEHCLSRVPPHTLTCGVLAQGVSALPLSNVPGSPSVDQFGLQTLPKIPEKKTAQAQPLGLELTLCRARLPQLARATPSSSSWEGRPFQHLPQTLVHRSGRVTE